MGCCRSFRIAGRDHGRSQDGLHWLHWLNRLNWLNWLIFGPVRKLRIVWLFYLDLRVNKNDFLIRQSQRVRGNQLLRKTNNQQTCFTQANGQWCEISVA